MDRKILPKDSCKDCYECQANTLRVIINMFKNIYRI